MNGEDFLRLLQRAGLKQKDLADCLKISITSVNRWAADEDRLDKVRCPPSIAFFLLVWEKLRPDERAHVDSKQNFKEDLAVSKSLWAVPLLREDELKEVILELNKLYN